MATNIGGIIAGAKEIGSLNLAQQFAYNSDSLVEYAGEAAPGSTTASSVWRIKKLTYSGTNLSKIEFADGNTNFDNVWDNHASLLYS